MRFKVLNFLIFIVVGWMIVCDSFGNALISWDNVIQATLEQAQNIHYFLSRHLEKSPSILLGLSSRAVLNLLFGGGFLRIHLFISELDCFFIVSSFLNPTMLLALFCLLLPQLARLLLLGRLAHRCNLISINKCHSAHPIK